MSGAYNESREIVHNDEDEIKRKYAEFSEKFRDTSTEQLSALDKELEDIKINAKKEMHSMIAQLSSQATEKISGIKTDTKDMETVLDSIDKEAA